MSRNIRIGEVLVNGTVLLISRKIVARGFLDRVIVFKRLCK